MQAGQPAGSRLHPRLAVLAAIAGDLNIARRRNVVDLRPEVDANC